MSKKQRIAAPLRNQRLPDVLNIDDIAIMPDEDLVAKLQLFNAERDNAMSIGQSSIPWETEICYIKREMQIRRQRREAHDYYVRQQNDELAELQRQEETLPYADLDNSQYFIWN